MPAIVLTLTDRGSHTITISDDAGHVEELDFPYFEATRCVRIASLLQGFLSDPSLSPARRAALTLPPADAFAPLDALAAPSIASACYQAPEKPTWVSAHLGWLFGRLLLPFLGEWKRRFLPSR